MMKPSAKEELFQLLNYEPRAADWTLAALAENQFHGSSYLTCAYGTVARAKKMAGDPPPEDHGTHGTWTYATVKDQIVPESYYFTPLEDAVMPILDAYGQKFWGPGSEQYDTHIAAKADLIDAIHEWQKEKSQ